MHPALSSRRNILLGAAALVAAGGVFAWRTLAPKPVHSRIVVADSAAVASALFYVARDQGYFAAEGIALETIKTNSGKEALELVAKGQADLGMVAEAPFVRAIAAGVPARIVATVETSERNTGIIVPDQSPIRAPADLKGRRVGFCPGTASEYFLNVFLAANLLAESDLQAVPVTPKDAHQALAAGTVDALSGWQEIRAHADKALGQRTRIFYAQGTYLETWNLVALAGFLDANPQAVEGFIRALLKAQSFVAANQEAAITIAAQAIGIDRATIAEMWPDYAFDLSLDQALIANLEGHWRMLTEQDASTPMPDFMAELAPNALQAADASRVTYLR
ncbi:ABC transporter substrate-binding protein [Dongia sp.]|uniref:ABC transporter substrate-binding protein n=1 Tax=Dongia sp. TaxID=1977262 RepID=UPI003753377B